MDLLLVIWGRELEEQASVDELWDEKSVRTMIGALQFWVMFGTQTCMHGIGERHIEMKIKSN